MKVSRWGNSLAVRLPRELVDELSLHEGDELELRPVGDRCVELLRDTRRADALARIKAMQRPLPPGYRFDRDEIYDRWGPDSPGRKPYGDE